MTRQILTPDLAAPVPVAARVVEAQALALRAAGVVARVEVS